MPTRAALRESHTVTATFPGELDAPPAVEVTRESGDILTTGTATHIEEGVYTFSFTPVELDELEARFTGLLAAVPIERREVVQVAGRHYFATAGARGPASAPQFGGVGHVIDDTYTDEDIERHRLATEDQIEINCGGASFVPRYQSEAISGTGESFIRLRASYVLDLIEVLEDGDDITDDVVLDGRYVWRKQGRWPWGHRQIIARYSAGYSAYPPGDLALAALTATRYSLARERRTGAPPQATSLNTDAGTVSLAIAGLRHPTGIPEVDAVILRMARAVGEVI